MRLRNLSTLIAYPVINGIQLVEEVACLPDELLECSDRLRIGRHAQNRAVALQLLQQLLTVLHTR
jgi:hypothetical protein